MQIPERALTATVVQTDAGPEVDANLEALEAMNLGATGADVICLPETFPARGGRDELHRQADEDFERVSAYLANLARTAGAWVHGGSLIERANDSYFNTSLLFDRNGREVARYRKIHLFDVDLADGARIRESDSFAAGADPVSAELDGWVAGLSICYDLRFPELYRRYADRRAHLLFIPANFTDITGKAHWHTLVRARAIENQCYVVAANQCGVNVRTEVASFGHSLVVDPWGEVVLDLSTGPGLATVTLAPERLRTTRSRVPALEHRRLPA